MSIKIIVDSASDIVLSEAQEMGVELLPIEVNFDGELYLDGVTMSHREFFEKLIESDNIPKTSQISEYTFDEKIKEVLENYDEVLIITMSKKLSGTHSQAVAAAKKYGDKVQVVDSCNVCIGEYLLVKYALMLIEQGKTLSEIKAELDKKKKHIKLRALLATLKYLRKGGRISALTFISGEMLSIKPVLAIEDGEIKVIGKAMGSKKGNNLINKLIDEIGGSSGIDFDLPYGCVYSGLDSTVLDKYIADCSGAWREHTEGIPKRMIGATIGTHIGPGALAVAFFDKLPD